MSKCNEQKAVLRYPAGAQDHRIEIDEERRQRFCDETYQEMIEVAKDHSWNVYQQEQRFYFTTNRHYLNFYVNFGGNFLGTWMECFYEPAGFSDFTRNVMLRIDEDLRRSGRSLAAAGLSIPQFVELSSKVSEFPLETPHFARTGWNDSQLLPAESANKFASALKSCSRKVPMDKSFSGFIASSEHYSLYRQAHVMALLFENKKYKAVELLEKILKGEVRVQTGTKYRLSDGTIISGERLLHDWLTQRN